MEDVLLIALVVAITAAVAGAVTAMVRERKMHFDAELGDLGFFGARQVLRTARTGAVSDDPVARLEAVRLLESHQDYAARTMRWLVPLLGIAAVVIGVIWVILSLEWYVFGLALVSASSAAELVWDWRQGDRRLRLLRQTPAETERGIRVDT